MGGGANREQARDGISPDKTFFKPDLHQRIRTPKLPINPFKSFSSTALL